MSNNFLPSDSFSQHQPHWIIAILIAIALHLVLIGFVLYWHPAPKIPKTRNRVYVQTVQVSSNQLAAATAQPVKPAKEPAPTLPQPVPKVAENPPVIAEVSPPPPPAVEPIQEEPPKPQPKPKPKPEAPPPAPPPKTESPPKPKTPPAQPAPKEVKKPTPEKKPVPAPKTVEPVKKEVKAEPEKTKKIDDAEKKRQQEQAEAEKKRQQLKAEEEKKRQKELEEAQKKQEEIYLAKIAKSKETLAKMGKSRDNINAHSTISLDATAIPKELGALQIDSLPLSDSGNPRDWGAQEMTYREKVASHLKKALRLPDFGAVTIKLTISREGKVVKVETTQSENSKNKAYIEREVMQLQFPRFGQEFQGSSEYTFQYHLHNDA